MGAPNGRRRELMEMAIAEARKCKPESKGVHPRVGVVVADADGEVVLTAHRSEEEPGEHAEFTIVKKAKRQGISLEGKTLFVTLEPCTERGPDKTPCYKHILKSGISQVWVGMLDPNPAIRGQGVALLEQGGVEIDLFPSELRREIRDINSPFMELHRITKLPGWSLYVSNRISDIMCELLNRQGVAIDKLSGEWDLTVDDLLTYCAGFCDDKTAARLPALIRAARATAFDKKYLDYTYEHDARGTDKAWHQDVRSILAKLGAADYLSRHVLCVGIGNGLEGEGLLEGLPHLTIADIAPKSLERAQRRIPNATPLVAEAEDLSGVRSGSQQLYICLRTYQSYLFDMPAALREAHRVLAKGGCLLLSISNGYIGEDGALIPGHVIPGTDAVDRDRPWSVAKFLIHKLDVLRFERINIRSEPSEIYVFARKGV